jgi:hypothetical protein
MANASALPSLGDLVNIVVQGKQTCPLAEFWFGA